MNRSTETNNAKVDEAIMGKLFKRMMAGSLDLKDIMKAVTSAGNPRDWCQTPVQDGAYQCGKGRKYLGNHYSGEDAYGLLVGSYESNDRTLRYKHIDQYFYMDILFAARKVGKPLRGHQCFQSSITNKSSPMLLQWGDKEMWWIEWVVLLLQERYQVPRKGDTWMCVQTSNESWKWNVTRDA